LAARRQRKRARSRLNEVASDRVSSPSASHLFRLPAQCGQAEGSQKNIFEIAMQHTGDASVERGLSMFRRNLKLQSRVIGALIIREIYSRFGRQNLGFAWVIAEPLTFALPVLGVWSLIRSPFERGLPMIPFLWSGYLPLMMFRHVTGRMLMFIRVNSGLLYHRQVTIFDLFVARALLEILSNFLAVVFSAALFLLIGVLKWPTDLPLFYLGYFYMMWWTIAVAMIVGGLSERSELVEKIWSPMSYLYMAVSGFFFLSNWLPPHLRAFALKAMPSIQAYDMIRAGLFGRLVVHPHYDLPYMSVLFTVLTLIGMLLLREAKKHLEIG
jgi:capsular polysaccharide transport system permease protein